MRWATLPPDVTAQARTPYYWLDLALLQARAHAARVLGVHLLYAVKANPHPRVLSALHGLVEGLDVASEGELARAVEAGFQPAQLSLTGPAKSEAFLEAAVHGGACINLESERELRVVCELAARHRRSARVRVRINPSLTFRAYRVQMTGGPSAFGVDEEALDSFAPLVLAGVQRGLLQLEGVHVHPGAQGTSVKAFELVVTTGLALLAKLRRLTGLDLRALNVGGGLGAIAPGDELELPSLAPLLAAFERDEGVAPDVWCEPGRWLVGPCGLYVTRVVSTKQSRGVRFVIVDGGVHHHFAASTLALPPGATRADVLNLSRPDAPKTRCTVVGALCTPLDSFGELELPDPREGDVLAFQGAGAYGLTFSPSAFLSHRPPDELFG